MKEVNLGKLVGQIFEQGIRLAEEIEKEMKKQVEAEREKERTVPTTPKQTKQAPPVDSLQAYVIENLRFQGYEIEQGAMPSLIHVSKKDADIAELRFGANNHVYIDSAVAKVESAPMQAHLNIEHLKAQLLQALQMERSNGVINETALALTDAFVAERVAKEDAQAYQELVQILNALLNPTQGVH